MLSEIWRSASDWAKFKSYLSSISYGEGIDGEPLSMDRYAIFLDRVGSLKCIDAEMMKDVLENVKNGDMEGSREVFK